MNILFLTLLNFNSIKEHNIYTDFLREFVRQKHSVYVVSPVERKTGEFTRLKQEKNVTILKLKIGNIQKTNLIEKGISTLTLEHIFIYGIKKYFSDVKFDLVIYSTPPITLQKAVEYIKKRDSAITYLLLKDIFPQNAVDIKILNKKGIQGILYFYFRKKEERLYKTSDYIGCMSPANVKYLLEHNPYLNKDKVHVSPNCIEVKENDISESQKQIIREKYKIPLNVKTFIYGGNLGKPQGVPFIIECLKANENKKDRFFIICGNGTEFGQLKRYVDKQNPNNVLLLNGLQKREYDDLVKACDVGLIFLDYRFTIPNFPSRLLSYMEAELPVLACTDPNTDIGNIISHNEFGWKCFSNDVGSFNDIINLIINMQKNEITKLGKNSRKFLLNNYTTEVVYVSVFRGFINDNKTG
ncbi:glycosyltransferase family 4 protein [Ruminococcus gauvreauii]|uniref:glycosyltransferase family 4 protein n=1 Tax=Ruminococcus gauvreauii TaxID=438033 RepID=UPI003983DDB4